jgi:hypothetical protein
MSRVPRWLVVTAAFLLAVGGVIVARFVSYGFAGKTVWDYLDVFLVPVAVAAATFWLTSQQNRRQRKDEDARRAQEDRVEEAQRKRELAVENERAQDEALESYLDGMSQLLTDKERPLHRSRPGDSLRTVARARTLTVLTRLDGVRKRSVVQFLRESALITDLCGGF